MLRKRPYGSFELRRRKHFDKSIGCYLIVFNGGIIQYKEGRRIIKYFPKASFSDISYIKSMNHAKTSYEVFRLCWSVYVQGDKTEIKNIKYKKEEH